MLRGLPTVATLLAALVLVAPAAASTAGAGGNGGTNVAVVVVSGDVVVPRGETVDDVFVAVGDVRIAGEVKGDVVVFDGDVRVSGRIGGDLFTADGIASLLPSAEVGGDVRYGDEHPHVSLDARVHGDVTKEGWPDAGDLTAWIGSFVVRLAIALSLLILGALLLLVAPRAADSLYARSRERVGPTLAIGIAILIVLPLLAVIAAITVVGIPFALGLGLAFAPFAAVAYSVAAYALGRRLLGPPRHRLLALLAGLAILRLLALVPFLGFLVGLVALIWGAGLIGAAIGAARAEPAAMEPARTPYS